uniref:Uncharacterized protein n=1 Tax=Spongospora subterranea TaxID=70186 RepID=A0A0H5QTB4_9EUKA|eukprot:CRZ05248.1 hypothetical protein [Spongospora subterranea]
MQTHLCPSVRILTRTATELFKCDSNQPSAEGDQIYYRRAWSFSNGMKLENARVDPAEFHGSEVVFDCQQDMKQLSLRFPLSIQQCMSGIYQRESSDDSWKALQLIVPRSLDSVPIATIRISAPKLARSWKFFGFLLTYVCLI